MLSLKKILISSAKATLFISSLSLLTYQPAFSDQSNIEITKDELTSEGKYILRLKSTNQVVDSIGYSKTVSFFVRCGPQRAFDLFLSTPTYNADSSIVYVRWNDGAIETQYWGRGVGGDAYFTKTPKQFLDKMLGSESMVLGWRPYSSETKSARYDLQPYKNDLLKMAGYCAGAR